MDYHIPTFRKWLTENLTLSNAYSGKSLRILASHVLKGGNYRSITERNTKDKLFLTYLWLLEICNHARAIYGDDWKQGLVTDLNGIKRKSKEQQDLHTWLIGLPHKTADNLDVKGDLSVVLQETYDYFSGIFTKLGKTKDLETAWLFLMAGAATLTIRGSDKSKVGKELERVLIKTALTILGFTFNENFWINIERDREVGRETDAEVQTRRGRIRLEVGLIAAGNQEVIEDKIGRMGQNGIILYDKIGERSNIHDTAKNKQVHLIQIRGGRPMAELYEILRPLVNIPLHKPPETPEGIDKAVAELPDELFESGHPKKTSVRKSKKNLSL
ncbi:MAG: CfrBI family restriction endonuclease [Puia sp.]|nr:CfrBI family restriction endonuclease [Puia sp.]